MSTFSREYLQSLPVLHRDRTINSVIQQYENEVVSAATAGKAFHLVNVSRHLGTSNQRRGMLGHHTYPPAYQVTADDLVEGFKKKFPGCRVEYTETWEDVRPGVKEQRSGILVDWS
jgi:hypothetical protein